MEAINPKDAEEAGSAMQKHLEKVEKDSTKGVKLTMRQIGIHLGYWTTGWLDDVLPLLERASNAGFDGAELPLRCPEEMDFSAIYRVAVDLGLKLTCCTSLPTNADLSSRKQVIRQRGIDRLKRCLEGAATVKSPVLAGIIYTGWGASEDNEPLTERWKRSAEALAPIAKMAESLNITLCLEVVNRFEGAFINNVTEGLTFLKQFHGINNMKLLLDTFHLNIEEDDLAEAVRRAGAQLGHFHCAANNRKRPGLGHIPWSDLRCVLDDIDYRGWLVMESFVANTGLVGPITHPIFVMREELDDYATAAAAFMRETLA